MIGVTFRKPVLTVLATFALVACNDASVTAPSIDLDALPPTSDAVQDGNAAVLGAPDTSEKTTSSRADGLSLVDRTSPLASSVSRSKTVGSAGGWIDLNEAGIKVLIPSGALSEDVEITLTALAGSKMALDLQPHGLHLDRPIEIWVDKTQANLPTSPVVGVHFNGHETSPTILESFPVFDGASWIGFGTIYFSGYALASM